MIDVLVVGAGPTGLTLAAELVRRGVTVRVIDKAPAATTLSKALVIHARTLEICEDMGIADQLLARGLALSGVQILANGQPIVSASLEELDTRYAFALSIPQCETEAVLGAHLVRLGGAVERGVELTALAQDDDGVTGTIAHADGRSETVRARWLVGCDGAHSAVRKLLGLSFAGRAYDETFLLADVKVRWELPRDRITSFFGTDGVMACFPMPGDRWRLIASCPAADGTDGPALAEVQALVDARCGSTSEAQRSEPLRGGSAAEDARSQWGTLSDPAWMARFRINSRQVSRYQVGRVFVAGDAAHIHSPVGGQGMNTGMQDAHNLAWKLALTARGRAAPGLVDTYHTERHGIGAALLRATDVATRVGTVRGTVARAMRDGLARFLSSLEVIQQRIARSTAELTLSYAGSPIVGEQQGSVLGARLGALDSDESATVGAWRDFAAAPHAGARAPDAQVRSADGTPRRLAQIIDGRRHTLLLFDGRAATDEGYARLARIARRVEAGWSGEVDVHVVVPTAERPAALDWSGSVLFDVDGDLEDRYGGASECLYLIRPDLYVGFRSQPADEAGLVAHLARVVTVSP